jgi:hypothetical protein
MLGRSKLLAEFGLALSMLRPEAKGGVPLALLK